MANSAPGVTVNPVIAGAKNWGNGGAQNWGTGEATTTPAQGGKGGGAVGQPNRNPVSATPDWMEKIQHPPGTAFTQDFQQQTFTDPATGATFQGDPRQWQMKGSTPVGGNAPGITPTTPAAPLPQFYDSQGNKQLGNFTDNILQHIVGKNVLEGDRLAAADITGDGKVNISDATGFLRRQTGLEDWGEGKGADYYNQFYQQGDRYVDNPNAGQKRGDKYMKYVAPMSPGITPYPGVDGGSSDEYDDGEFSGYGKGYDGEDDGGNYGGGMDDDRGIRNAQYIDTNNLLPSEPGLKKIVPGGAKSKIATDYLGSVINPSNNNPTPGGKGGGAVGTPTPGGKGGGAVGQPTTPPGGGYNKFEDWNTDVPKNPMNLPGGGKGFDPGTATNVAPNINTQSAQGITNAMKGTQQEMGYNPSQVYVPGTSSTIGDPGQSSRIGNPGQSGLVGGVNPSTRIGDPGQSGTIGGVNQSGLVGGVNQSAQVQAGQLSGTNFNPYMNPYTDAVIKSVEGDILRGGEKQLTGLGSKASSAGAFGGSRHGIAMGEVGRNITEQMAKSSTGLRQANFQQAQNAAQQDINTRMQAGQLNQNASQFDIGNIRQQQMANQNASQFDIGNVRQQQLANQNASQFDIGNKLKAGQLNQQASQFDIGNTRQAQMANQDASQFDIGNKLKAGQLNQQASQYDIGNVRQAQLANQTAGMQDIQNMMNAQQFNQTAGMQGSQNRLSASSQLGALSNLGFGMGQTVQGNLSQQGNQQQLMVQALIDAAKSQYGGYTGAPAEGLGYVTQALGATGTPTSTTSSSNPGLFGLLTAASQIPGLFPSDKRLKKNITKMGTLKSGLNIYKWDWKEGAEKFGADMNHTLGVIAQETKELFPNAVVKMDNGYYAVNYSALK